MVRVAVAVLFSLISASSVSASIIYEPVQYQYRDPRFGQPAFYYGGSNPLVLRAGANLLARYHAGPEPSRDILPSYVTEGRFGYNATGPLRFNLPPAITYSDLLPSMVNAYPYGVSVDDARNEAYAHVPLYFRKSDLLESAIRTRDGSIVVPAQAPLRGTIEIRPYHREPTTSPTTQPTTGPILIIPIPSQQQPSAKPVMASGAP